jgi:hypothetical protein
MRAFRKSLWTIAIVLALPSPAAAREPVDVCGPLGRLIAAARERPAFRSVQRRLAAGEALLPGFRASGCRVTVGQEVSCGDHWGRASFIHWPNLANCPGVVAVVERPPPPAGPDSRHDRNSWTSIHRVGNLRIEQGMNCVTCRGPAPARFIIAFDPPRRRAR